MGATGASARPCCYRGPGGRRSGSVRRVSGAHQSGGGMVEQDQLMALCSSFQLGCERSSNGTSTSKSSVRHAPMRSRVARSRMPKVGSLRLHVGASIADKRFARRGNPLHRKLLGPPRPCSTSILRIENRPRPAATPWNLKEADMPLTADSRPASGDRGRVLGIGLTADRDVELAVPA